MLITVRVLFKNYLKGVHLFSFFLGGDEKDEGTDQLEWSVPSLRDQERWKEDK